MTNSNSASTPSSATISSSFEMEITGVSPAPTYAFFSRLNVYTAALIAYFVNVRTLRSRPAHHLLSPINVMSSVRVPYLLMRLSELLPSQNKSARTGRPWAKDSVMLTFQGLERAAPEEIIPTVQPASPSIGTLAKAKAKANTAKSPAATHAVAVPPASPPSVPQQPPVTEPREMGPGEGVVIVTQARMSVPVPQALTILQERVDQDIAFDAKSGTFAFRLRSKVGESVIPAFVERAIRVERLVDFAEVLHKHEQTIKCEYISLGRIVFTYGTANSTDAMDIDGSRIFKATIDFGATDSLMTLRFDQGNPHLRIQDNLSKVLNGRQGLDGVAYLLPLTLPALRALDNVEGAWTTFSGKATAIVFVRAVEWYVVRYEIPLPDQPRPRKIMLEIKLQHRRGEAWWYIRRTDVRSREGDDLDAALKPVWDSSGEGWRGMRLSAVAQSSGMEQLIGKLDVVLRNFATGATAVEPASSAPAQAPAPAQGKPPQRAPEAPMMAQAQRPQQRQQPTPNQSQSQNQGRNTPNQSQGRNTPSYSQNGQLRGGAAIKREWEQDREIVEID